MQQEGQKTRHTTIFDDFFSFVLGFFSYIFLRFRQVLFYSWALYIWLRIKVGGLKNSLVRRMFWGRSVFYRSAFQLSVGFITILLGIGGLSGRLRLFVPAGEKVLAFPTEVLGDSDYMDEGESMQSIVSKFAVTRDFEVQKYIVQRGDTLTSIAQKFDVSEDTIRWANGITGDYIKVGQELEVLPINGVVHTVKEGDTLASISDKYEASQQDIYDINWLDSKILKTGQELLVPNGRMPQPKPVIRPIATQPAYTPPTAPTPPPNAGGAATGSFVRPAACGRITNYFSPWHGGVDIAQHGGCQILAADGGVVTMARWYGAGGLQVMINHGNGYVTLYAHHSALYVKEGQRVTRGQPIGYMGCTGRCTGTHLHFGVQLNGIWVNPLAHVPV